MSLLLDTNVLLRLGDQGSPFHGEALAAVEALEAAGQELMIVPQVLYEYWVVATRPTANNGLGMTVETATAAIERWTSTLHLLLDERGIYSHWHALVTTHDVKGKNAHDARLVAAMQRHGLTNLVTFNKADFTRFRSIHVFTPSEILAGQLPA